MNKIESIQNIIYRNTEIFDLLSQLTNAPKLPKSHFENILQSLKSNHDIFVYIRDDNLVGMITILIEQKLIHGGKCVAHIEDLVVDKKYNGQGIAKELLSYMFQIARDNNCYKVILDCDKNIISFYEKSGFKEKEVQMVYYF